MVTENECMIQLPDDPKVDFTSVFYKFPLKLTDLYLQSKQRFFKFPLINSCPL